MRKSLRKLGTIALPLGALLLLAGLMYAQGNTAPPYGVGKEDPNDKYETSLIPYVDTHAHFDAKFFADKALEDPDRAVRLTIEAMDAEHAGKFIMMPSPYGKGDPATKDLESFVTAVKKRSDRLAFQGGGGTLNIMIQEAEIAGSASPELKRKFKERAEEILRDGAVGFGEMAAFHPGNQEYAFTYAAADNPLYLILADVAAAGNVPIDLHNEAVGPGAKPPNADFFKFAAPGLHMMEMPDTIGPLERLADHNPKARIIWAHAGNDLYGYRTPDLCRRLLKAHPNLFMEIHASPTPGSKNAVITFPGGKGLEGDVVPEWLALFREFPDRFDIGTDIHYGLLPQLTGRRSMAWRGAVHFLNKLPPDLREKIGVENALHIYPKTGWTAKEILSMSTNKSTM